MYISELIPESPEGKKMFTYLNGGVLFAMMTNFAFPCLRVSRVFLYPNVYLPDFMTRARRELMDSTAFFCFF